MNKLLDVAFPFIIDNKLPGLKIVLWCFYALTAITLWRSSHHIFAADGGAQSIATIPLEQYSAGSSATIIGLFSLWGLSQLLLGLVMLLASFCYRAMIPFLLIIIFIEYCGRYFIWNLHSIETIGTAPGSIINIPFAVISFLLIMACLNFNQMARKKADELTREILHGRPNWLWSN